MKSIRLIIYICALLGLGVLIGFSNFGVEAEPTYSILELTLDNKPLQLSKPVYLIGEEPAIPMRAFASAFNIQANWFPETEEITLYKSNNFMRFKLNSLQAKYNGYDIQLPFAPVTIDKQIYLPLKSIASGFDFFYSGELQQAQLTTRDSTRYYTYEDHFLQTQIFPTFKYTLALPYGWNELGENLYGINDEYDDYNLRLGSVELSSVKAQDLYGYRDLLKSELSKQYATKLQILGEGNLIANEERIEFISYQLNLASGTRNYETFLVENNGFIYTFDASFAPSEDVVFMSKLYRYVMGTLQFPNRTISRDHEHYVEQSPFVSLGIQLTTPLGSSQEVMHSAPLAGSIVHHKKIESMYVVISKDSKQLKLTIPIAPDGTFNTTLHMPFGSGKHNVELLVQPSDGSAEQSLLLLSLVNLSNRVTQHLISTKYIQSDVTEVKELTASLIAEKVSSYSKSKVLFDWVLENIRPEFALPKSTYNLSINPPRTLPEIIDKGLASPIEYNLLLAGMLRSIGQEAKVVAALKNNVLTFYVESYINGRWVAMDPYSAVLAREYPHLTEFRENSTPSPINQFKQYHYIPLTDFQKLFDAYSEVN